MAKDAPPLVEALQAIINAGRAYLPPEGIERTCSSPGCSRRPTIPRSSRRAPLMVIGGGLDLVPTLLGAWSLTDVETLSQPLRNRRMPSVPAWPWLHKRTAVSLSLSFRLLDRDRCSSRFLRGHRTSRRGRKSPILSLRPRATPPPGP
jgi:hypothetical protein